MGKSKNICFNGRYWLDEHRRLMEVHLNRELKSDELVHHINGNHFDNRIENLQVVSAKEHAQLHKEMNKRSKPLSMKKLYMAAGMFITSQHSDVDEDTVERHTKEGRKEAAYLNTFLRYVWENRNKL